MAAVSSVLSSFKYQILLKDTQKNNILMHKHTLNAFRCKQKHLKSFGAQGFRLSREDLFDDEFWLKQWNSLPYKECILNELVVENGSE